MASYRNLAVGCPTLELLHDGTCAELERCLPASEHGIYSYLVTGAPSSGVVVKLASRG